MARRWLAGAIALVAVLTTTFSVRAAAPAGRYSAAGGVVQDSKTGLNWQQGTSTTSYTWAAAMSYCSNNAAGLPGTGWTLPTIKQLQTLVDDRASSAPTIDTSFFPSTQSTVSYWSSTGQAQASGGAWHVNFNDGGTDTSAVTDSHYVRCVR